jgi:hypothetical protein
MTMSSMLAIEGVPSLLTLMTSARSPNGATPYHRLKCMSKRALAPNATNKTTMNSSLRYIVAELIGRVERSLPALFTILCRF